MRCVAGITTALTPQHRDGLNDVTDAVRSRTTEAAEQAEHARDASLQTLQLHEDIRESVKSTMNETQEALADVRTMAGMFSAPILAVRAVLNHRVPVGASASAGLTDLVQPAD